MNKFDKKSAWPFVRANGDSDDISTVLRCQLCNKFLSNDLNKWYAAARKNGFEETINNCPHCGQNLG
jgi:hypothetical protein